MCVKILDQGAFVHFVHHYSLSFRVSWNRPTYPSLSVIQSCLPVCLQQQQLVSLNKMRPKLFEFVFFLSRIFLYFIKYWKSRVYSIGVRIRFVQVIFMRLTGYFFKCDNQFSLDLLVKILLIYEAKIFVNSQIY